MKKEEQLFLSTHKEFALATVGEDHKPKLRVFQCMKQEGTTLYFATSPKKEVYRQLQQNPYLELLALDGDVSMRISGEALFDVDDQVCREIYQENEILIKLYADYKELVYFKVDIDQLDYFDLSQMPPLHRSSRFPSF